MQGSPATPAQAFAGTNARRTRWTPDAGALALLFVIITAIFADVLFLGSNFYQRDLLTYYYPTKHIVREVVQAGEFPYWNPYYSAGQPLAANPEYEVFYPPQWLVFLPDYDLGFRLHIIVHIYVAAFGMYLLLRSLGLQILTAILGSLAFALGGPYLSLINLLPMMFSVAWMPWVFLFARRLFQQFRVRDFALAALFLGMQGLIGEPSTLLQTGLLIGAYGLYDAWKHETRRRAMQRNVAVILLLALAGGAAGAVQLAPAFDHAADSVRGRGLEFATVAQWSMPFPRPLEIFFPQIFGKYPLKGARYWGAAIYPDRRIPFLASFYLGLCAAVMLLCGFLLRRRGSVALLALVVASFVLAAGENTPLLRILYQTGVMAGLRIPEKFVLLALVPLTIWSAMIFDRRREDRIHRAAVTCALGITVLSIAVAAWSWTQSYRAAFATLWSLGASPIVGEAVSLSRAGWIRSAAAGLVLSALLFFCKNRPSRAASGAWILFVVADLGLAGDALAPRLPRNFFEPPAVIAELNPGTEAYRIFHLAEWQREAAVAKRYFGSPARRWIIRNGLFPKTTARWGVRTVLDSDVDLTLLTPTEDLIQSMWEVLAAGRADWDDIFMAMSNVHYRTAYRPYEAEMRRIGGDVEQVRPIEFVPAPPYPRYYFADQMVSIRDRRDFVAQLAARSWSRRVAFVGFPAFSPAAGRVLSATETANTARIEVEAEGKSFWVASVTPHKYWRATVDGVETPLAVTNIGYQGLVVAAGKHVIEMRYENTLIPWAAAVSVLTLAGLAAVAAFGFAPGPDRLRRS